MKINKIDNPLTVVGLFAGISEISMTYAISKLPFELQSIFIWFMILFPCLIVILFFITLNFNASVLYSPSDYKDESNYMLANAKNKTNLVNAVNEANDLANEIAFDINIKPEAILTPSENIEKSDPNSEDKVADLVRKVNSISERFSQYILSPYDSLSNIEKLVITKLQEKPMTLLELSDSISQPRTRTKYILDKLNQVGIVQNQSYGRHNMYCLNADYLQK